MPSPQNQPQQSNVRHAIFVAKVSASTDDAASDARTVDVVASTPQEDRYGRIVLQDWDLATYEKNPVVLWNHGDGGGFWGDSSDTNLTLPIGFASNVRVDNGQLLATLNFVDASANPIAEKVYQGIRQGSIRAVSVGWIPHDVRYEVHDDVEVLICAQNELLEISPVAIPANPGAGAIGASLFASLRAAAQPTKEIMLKKHLIAALGLKASASDADITAAVDKIINACNELKDLTKSEEDSEESETTDEASTKAAESAAALLKDIAAKLGVKPTEAAAALVGLLASDAAGKKAAADLAKLGATSATAEVEDLLKQGRDAGKLTPANELELLASIGATVDEKAKTVDLASVNAKQLASLLKYLPASFATKPTKTPPVGPATAALTPEELAYCERNNKDPKQYAASKARVTGSKGN